jgi:hypothetical protein
MGNGGFDAVVVENVSGFVGGHVGVLSSGTSDCFTPLHKELVRNSEMRSMPKTVLQVL